VRVLCALWIALTPPEPVRASQPKPAEEPSPPPPAYAPRPESQLDSSSLIVNCVYEVERYVLEYLSEIHPEQHWRLLEDLHRMLDTLDTVERKATTISKGRMTLEQLEAEIAADEAKARAKKD
jgi:hypothetical protein